MSSVFSVGFARVGPSDALSVAISSVATHVGMGAGAGAQRAREVCDAAYLADDPSFTHPIGFAIMDPNVSCKGAIPVRAAETVKPVEAQLRRAQPTILYVPGTGAVGVQSAGTRRQPKGRLAE